MIVHVRSVAGALAILAVVGILWFVSESDGGTRVDPYGDVVDDAYAEPTWDAAPGLDDLGGLVGEATEGLTTEGADAQVTETIVDALDDLGDYTSERRDEELTVAATEVLEDYRAQGVELVFADYLGVLEETWACLVKGNRWVEICVVREDEADGSSKVETVHFDADRFAAALPSELFEPGALDSLSSELDALLDQGGGADAASTDEGVVQ